MDFVLRALEVERIKVAAYLRLLSSHVHGFPTLRCYSARCRKLVVCTPVAPCLRTCAGARIGTSVSVRIRVRIRVSARARLHADASPCASGTRARAALSGGYSRGRLAAASGGLRSGRDGFRGRASARRAQGCAGFSVPNA